MTEDQKAQQPAPDPGNTDPECLTEPVDEDDDVYQRVEMVNREQPYLLEEAPADDECEPRP